MEECEKIERKWCISFRWPWFKKTIQQPTESWSVRWGVLERGGADGLECMGGGVVPLFGVTKWNNKNIREMGGALALDGYRSIK